MIDWLRARSTAQLLVLASGLAAIVFFLRILVAGEPTATVLLLLLGLCTAWSANVAAALLLGLLVVAKIRSRPLPPELGTLAVLLVGVLGLGWLLAGLALLVVAFSDASMLLAIAGTAAIVLASRLRRRAPTTPLSIALLLASVIVAFQIPREIGTYSLHWKTSEAKWNWNASGGENCSGMNLGDRRAAIAPYRPTPVIESQLSGALGELVGQHLGQGGPPHPFVPNEARVHISGNVDYGGLGCHLPLHKTLVVHASLSTSTTFNPDLPDASLSCSASHQITFDVNVTATGIASCRDLATEAAQHIADQIHAHARSVCGQ